MTPVLPFICLLLPGQREAIQVPVGVAGATIEGRALDARTREPLALIELELLARAREGAESRSPVRETVRADLQGCFHTTTRFPLGEIRARLRFPGDGYGSSASRTRQVSFDLDAETGRAELAFEVGPSLRLALRGASQDELAWLEAWLFPAGEPHGSSSRAALVPLREGTLFAQFPPPRNSLVSPHVLVLHAPVTNRGAWIVLGPAALDAPLEVELVSFGRLEVAPQCEAVADAEGESTWIEVSRSDGGPTYSSDRSWSRTRSLPPGRYLVRAHSRVHAPVQCEVEIGPGSVERVALALRALPRLRRLHGIIRSETGRASLDGVSVFILSAGEPPRGWTILRGGALCGNGIDAWIELGDELGAIVGRFELGTVPDVPLRATVGGCDGLAASYTLGEREDGDLQLDVLLHDDDGAPGYGFEIDAPTTIRDRISIHWSASDGTAGTLPSSRQSWRRRTVLARELPPGIRWCVSAPGMRLVFGDADDFTPHPRGRFARVRLEPGWGVRLQVRDMQDRPVENLGLLVDGAFAGATDARGELTLTRPAPPRRLAFELDELIPYPPLESLCIDTPWSGVTTVRLVPPPSSR